MKILAFSPHPDDAEVLMGGTIARYTQKGHDVRVVLVTIPNQKKERVEEAKAAAKILGADLLILDVDPYKLTFNRDIVESFDSILNDFLPDAIYTCWVHDSHQDHVAVSQAAIASARNASCPIYMYDQALPSGTTPYSFRAQSFVDISDTIDTKIQAVRSHKTQINKYSNSWVQGIKGRAAYWGFSINAQYAEAFEVVKEIREIGREIRPEL